MPEEDCPLQECQCAELPHQVSPHRPPVAQTGYCTLNISSLPPSCVLSSFWGVLGHFCTVFFTYSSALSLYDLILLSGLFFFSSFVTQLERWPGAVCPHPQTQTWPHWLLQTEKGSPSFPASIFSFLVISSLGSSVPCFLPFLFPVSFCFLPSTSASCVNRIENLTYMVCICGCICAKNAATKRRWKTEA